MTSAATIDNLLSRLSRVTQKGEGWEAECPCHDDDKNSLCVGIGDDGRVLLQCQAGCETKDVIDSIGLKWPDLFSQPKTDNGRGQIVATYDYQDENGALLFQSVRFEPKDFRQRSPNPSGGWTWKLNGVRRVLYRLPELLAADQSRQVIIVEGEKDVDRLIDIGFVATCNAGGAKKWRDEYSVHLQGRHVAILPDNDKPGRDHAEQVARSLSKFAASIKIIELPELPKGGDVSDWLNDGHSRARKRGDIMDRLTKLKQRLDAITAEQKAILAAATDGKLSEDQRKDYDKLQAEYEKLEPEFHSVKADLERIDKLGKRSDITIPQGPGRKSQPDSLHPDAVGGLDPPSTTVSHRTAGKLYREMFGQLSSNSGFGSFDDFLTAIGSQRQNEKLQPAYLAGSEGVASDGGFMVGEEHSAEMLDTALESEIIRPLADVRAMKTQTMKIASFAHSDASGGSLFGAFTGQWLGESDTGTVETAKTRRIELTAKKLFIYTRISNELAADGQSYVEQLSTAMTSSVAWHLDDSFLNGAGGNQPSGILGDPAIIEVAKETGQGAATINYDNLTKMFSRLHSASKTRAIWIASPTLIPDLLKLVIVIGTGGSVVPVMSESNGVFRLLTLPVSFSEKMKNIGTSGDLLLVDPSQYLIGIRREIVMDASNHIGFAEDETAFRTIVRCDAQGKWAAPYTPLHGSTQSWCVKLADRA